MRTNDTILLTGATGHLGTEIALELLRSGAGQIFVLVRDRSKEQAMRRLRTLWWDEKMLCNAVGKQIIPLTGDITFQNMGLEPQAFTHIVHCVAETGLMKSREELWSTNVTGTEHAIGYANLVQQRFGLQSFVYISTAYVAGRHQGIIREDAPLPDRFYSLYEESKAKAESLVRQSGLPRIITRPGMIVGNSKTGRTRNFNTIYYVLKLLLQNKLPLIPVSRKQTVNLIPVDVVAQHTVRLMEQPEAIGKTFHLTLPHEQQPQVGELVDATLQWAEQHLQIQLTKPKCLSIPVLRFLGGAFNAGNNKKRGFLTNLLALMPYFLDNHQFDRSNTDSLAGSTDCDWKEWLPAMLTFACRHNFMQLTGRSIFQQAMVRRESRHYPVTYYNIQTDGMRQVSGREMNGLIRKIVQVLVGMGIRKGDRIAVTGINCTEQGAIDCAIGLMGAVSVPIYYTTPAEEAQLLLERSGAVLFLVGDNRMMEQVKSLNLNVRIITFAGVKDLPNTISLSQLIASLPARQEEADITPPDADDLATIRYTSGTTGEPKGVMFNYGQLKWMGEVLTNLLPWKDRNSEMRYLSFLPMSHVVEGILASYAPYCMLCSVKFYYLNDFQMLTKALPQVRPTVFFSVPRFYEKLWEQIEANPLGQRYLTMKDGMARKVLARMLRKAVLKKAGLDCCSMLIVGSAPVSEEVLLKFRTLGIEIHNAYGQTEAPLITINRLGDNVIPSIGTALPDTGIRIAEDGELVVKGPQVAQGYYHLESETFRDGCLYTGDLGEKDAEGHIFLQGRKKDMLITSYGKNINCSKVEQRLTDISGISQAVLVGEQRPYCTALLWVEGNTSHIQAEIDRMNTTLSHPEQVKRWKVIERPLSIKDGELTPNLKVKRKRVWEHFSKEIEDLYE